MKLKPSPTHVVMNRGLWDRQSFRPENAEKIFAAGEKLMKAYPHTKFIWKTTNDDMLDLWEEGSEQNAQEEMNHALAHGWKVLDLFHSSKNIPSWYVDNFHVE